jgi:juvenile hormone diol kinase
MTFWNGLEQVARARGASQVTVTDWLEYWDKILQSPAMYDEMVPPIGRTLFSILDHDGDGAVTADEYAQTLTNSGVDASEAGSVFERLDTNHDGLLSVDEFVALADQFFRSEDPAAPGNSLFGEIRTEAGMPA